MIILAAYRELAKLSSIFFLMKPFSVSLYPCNWRVSIPATLPPSTGVPITALYNIVSLYINTIPCGGCDGDIEGCGTVLLVGGAAIEGVYKLVI